MASLTNIVVLSVLILAIWVLIEIKRLKHKLFAISLITLILFTYVSFSITLRNQDIDFKTISGITKATKLYFIWLGSLFGNMKTITFNAIKMDWGVNESVEVKGIDINSFKEK